MENQDSNQAVKLTVTFGDGHTADFDVFAAVVACGLMFSGVKDGRPYYSSPKEGYQNQVLIAMGVDIPAIAGILHALRVASMTIIENLDEQAKFDLVVASETFGTSKTTMFNSAKVIEIQPGDN